MLKQGVLPSVFPWSKLKKEPKKAAVKPTQEAKKETNEAHDKKETIEQEKETELPEVANDETQTQKAENPGEKSPPVPTTIEQNAKTVQTAQGPVTFAINERIEALDFNQTWQPAQIVEIDYEECEVLVRFDKHTTKNDEWICMDSARLRPLQPPCESFEIGERCMASWSDARKFPATVQKKLDKGEKQLL